MFNHLYLFLLFCPASFSGKLVVLTVEVNEVLRRTPTVAATVATPVVALCEDDIVALSVTSPPVSIMMYQVLKRSGLDILYTGCDR